MNERVKIKICGVRTAEVAEAAVEAGADYIGVVFAPRSVRFVTIDQARVVADVIRGRAQVVGLFVDGDLGEMRQAIAQVPLDRVQLHGAVDEKLVDFLAPLPVVVSVAFNPASGMLAGQLRRWEAFYRKPGGNLAAVLIDTPDPTKVSGGTGVAFDWRALRRMLDDLRLQVPMMLAGGLTPGNVAQAIEVVRPWGVDVSSGVESQRGVKDAAMVRAFCEAARGGADF